ncbi:thiamine biosynthesis protein ThiC [Bacillus safensis FO-36b] [Bacillus safensis subsp. safensis]
MSHPTNHYYPALTAAERCMRKDLRSDFLVKKSEISISNTVTDVGDIKNEAVRVYDTSGPYADENVHIEVINGLKRLMAVSM